MPDVANQVGSSLLKSLEASRASWWVWSDQTRFRWRPSWRAELGRRGGESLVPGVQATRLVLDRGPAAGPQGRSRPPTMGWWNSSLPLARTGTSWAADGVGSLRCGWRVPRRGLTVRGRRGHGRLRRAGWRRCRWRRCPGPGRTSCVGVEEHESGVAGGRLRRPRRRLVRTGHGPSALAVTTPGARSAPRRGCRAWSPRGAGWSDGPAAGPQGCAAGGSPGCAGGVEQVEQMGAFSLVELQRVSNAVDDALGDTGEHPLVPGACSTAGRRLPARLPPHGASR